MTKKAEAALLDAQKIPTEKISRATIWLLRGVGVPEQYITDWLYEVHRESLLKSLFEN